jgi:hypothetical protein
MIRLSRETTAFFLFTSIIWVFAGCPEGDLLRNQNRLDDAADAYTSCLERHPNHPGVLHNLGVSLIETGRHAQAIPYLQRALALAPSISQTHAALSQALLAARNCPEATHALAAAVRTAHSSSAAGVSANSQAMASWLFDTIASCPWVLSETSMHHTERSGRVSSANVPVKSMMVSGEDVLAAAVGWHKHLARYQLWLRVGEYAINADACHWALRAFTTAERLGKDSSVHDAASVQGSITNFNHNMGDDALFGSAICHQRAGNERAAWQTYLHAAHRGGVRRTLSLMAAYMSMLRDGEWSGAWDRDSSSTPSSRNSSHVSSPRGQSLFDRVQSMLTHQVLTRYLPDALGPNWHDFFVGNSRTEIGIATRGNPPAIGTSFVQRPDALLQPHEALALQLPHAAMHALTYTHAHAHAHTDSKSPPKYARKAGAQKLARTILTVGYASSDLNAHATSHLLKGAFALHNATRVHAVCFSLADKPAPGAADTDSLRDDDRVRTNEDVGQTDIVTGVGQTDIVTGVRAREWQQDIARSCEIIDIGGSADAASGARMVESRGVHVLCELCAYVYTDEVDEVVYVCLCGQCVFDKRLMRCFCIFLSKIEYLMYV